MKDKRKVLYCLLWYLILFLLQNLGDVVTGSGAQLSVPVQALTDLQGTVATTCFLLLPCLSLPLSLLSLVSCICCTTPPRPPLESQPSLSCFFFLALPSIQHVGPLPQFSHWVALLCKTKAPSQGLPWWHQALMWIFLLTFSLHMIRPVLEAILTIMLYRLAKEWAFVIG